MLASVFVSAWLAMVACFSASENSLRDDTATAEIAPKASVPTAAICVKAGLIAFRFLLKLLRLCEAWSLSVSSISSSRVAILLKGALDPYDRDVRIDVFE